MFQAKMIQLRHKILLCTDAALSSSLRLTGPEILSALRALLHVEYTETTFIHFVSEMIPRNCVYVINGEVLIGLLFSNLRFSIYNLILVTEDWRKLNYGNISEVILEKPQDGEHAQGT